jgi:hypothetical protein
MFKRRNVLLLFVCVSLFGCSAEKSASFPKQQAGEAAAVDGVAQHRGDARKGADREPAGGNRVAAPAADGKPAPAPAADKPAPRKIIYTGLVDLIVDDFDKGEQQLRQLVEDNGGYVDNSDIYNQPGAPRSGTWTIRVPTKNFDAFLGAVVKFGEVRKRTTNSQDVTDAYYDSAARLKADEAEEKSLLALLEKTQGKVEDILRVREQLRTVRGQIEQRKSQLQRWDKDVDMATVTVKLLDRRDYTPPVLPDFGGTVGRTFEGSINALVVFGKAIVLTVVALAPWVVVLGLLAAPGFVLWRRRRAASAHLREATLVAEEAHEPNEGAAP